MTEEKEKKEEGIDVFPFIEGETIDLVAGNSKWVPLICKWQNNPKVRRYARNIWPLTIEEIKKWFEPSPDRHMKEFVVFTIYHKADKRPIGSVGFGRINWVSRNANIFATIGEPEYWGKGIAIEANKLLIKYGFTELNFHKIYAGVFTPNKRSLRAAEKLGFEKEAVLKEEMYIDGVYHDVHKFALFKRDWIKTNQNDS
ncbi:MAG: GNAT family N-acetyltransferase [Promethearchaeota archaeon]